MGISAGEKPHFRIVLAMGGKAVDGKGADGAR